MLQSVQRCRSKNNSIGYIIYSMCMGVYLPFYCNTFKDYIGNREVTINKYLDSKMRVIRKGVPN